MKEHIWYYAGSSQNPFGHEAGHPLDQAEALGDASLYVTIACALELTAFTVRKQWISKPMVLLHKPTPIDCRLIFCSCRRLKEIPAFTKHADLRVTSSVLRAVNFNNNITFVFALAWHWPLVRQHSRHFACGHGPYHLRILAALLRMSYKSNSFFPLCPKPSIAASPDKLWPFAPAVLATSRMNNVCPVQNHREMPSCNMNGQLA